MKSIKQTYEIKAPIDKVWRAFVDPETIQKWGGGPAKMYDKEGTKFSLWGDDIFGINAKVIKEKLLEQDWTSGSWQKASKVVFRFNRSGSKTIVELEHSGVPDSDFMNIEKGWKDYYLGPMKDLLEQ